MAIEEAFGVSISDEEAETCVTPGMVIDVVLSKLRVTEERQCLSQKGLNLLRRALVETLNVQRNQVKPDFKLHLLAPKTQQKEIWLGLKEKVQARGSTARTQIL
jgi:hypothetical protein